MYLKTKIFVFLFFVLTSCHNVIESPVAKYNREFLKKNSMKIAKQKSKHKKIASENSIYYRDNKVDMVDEYYYEPIRGTKLKKEYRGKKTLEDYEQNNIEYMDSDLSLYYKQRNLKDFDTYSDDNSREVLFLAENYKDYTKESMSFDDIQPTSEQLYGSIQERKEKDYNYIESDVMQKNFDYIDVMNRVKNEIYLKQKDEQQRKERESGGGGVINSVVDRFKKLFGK